MTHHLRETGRESRLNQPDIVLSDGLTFLLKKPFHIAPSEFPHLDTCKSQDNVKIGGRPSSAAVAAPGRYLTMPFVFHVDSEGQLSSGNMFPAKQQIIEESGK